MFRRVLPQLLILAVLAGLLASPALACPTCKDGMEHDPAAMNMARGYFWSIMFMMSMPFVILASLGGYFYWEIRKARRLQQPADPARGPTLASAPTPQA